MKCRPRPIKFLAKFIRDFCPRCRCRCRTRTIALYTIINGNFCLFLLVSNIICYFCLLFSMFTALPFRQLPPIWMPSRRSPMRPPIPEVSSKVVNIKKHTKRNETLPPPAPRNCRNCTRTVRNIRYISYIHLLFMRLPSDVDGDSDCYGDVSVNVGHRSDFTHFTPISTRSSRVECLFFLFSGYSRISAFRYLYLFIGRASRSSLSLSLFLFSLIMQCRLTWAGRHYTGIGNRLGSGVGESTSICHVVRVFELRVGRDRQIEQQKIRYNKRRQIDK